MGDFGWLPVLGIQLEDDEVRREVGAGKGPMYVASTGTPDRLGDVVFPRWDLTDFHRTGSPALYNHVSDRLIGSWPKLAVVGDRLVGEFKPLETKNEWSWVGEAAVAGELKSASVGFLPGGIEVRSELAKDDPLYQPGDRWSSGLVFGRKGGPNVLLELTLCPVPANPDATALSLDTSRGDRRPFRTVRRGLVEEGIRQMRERGELDKLPAYLHPKVADALGRVRKIDPQLQADLSALLGDPVFAKDKAALPWLDGGIPWLR